MESSIYNASPDRDGTKDEARF